ncbi:hypothetical protein AB6A40_000649 [Gnathostoma spinigerum]|uniref:Uncharacterized protein n=1 Tax=Gnathostoma spinigerum TaxID=75299 RepID=A0ABD6E2H5_9BILA
MRRRLTVIFLLSLILQNGSSKKLPDKFLGTWKLEKFVNLDQYLQARGYRWLTRKLVAASSVTKIIRKAASGLPLRYDMETLTWKKNVAFKDIIIGRPFTSEHVEDGVFKVLFDIDDKGDTLTERVTNIVEPDDDETFVYMRDGELLIMAAKWKGVDASAIYIKIA